MSPARKVEKGDSIPRAQAPGHEESKQSNEVDSPGAGWEEREPKLFVDVNVANFGLQRIVVYDGDTVESLVSDFVKRCPIDDMMIEKLKLLLQQQMDGVLERIEEDDDQEASDEEDAGGKKSSGKNAQEGGRASVGRLKPQKQNSQIDLSNDPNQ